MRGEGLARALALLAAVALPAASSAASQERAITLARSELQAQRTVALTAPTVAPETAQALTLTLRFVEAPLTAEGGNQWTCTVRYRVRSGQTTHPARTLTLFRGTDRDVFEAADRIELGGVAGAELQIEAFDSPDPVAVPASVALEARWTSITWSTFTSSARPTLSFAATPAPALRWPAVTGAEEYEVESVFVDGLVSPAPADPFASALPVRVRTTATTLAVDLQRPAGTLWLRARAVGRHRTDPSARRPGAWSAALAVPITGAGFAPNMNWTFRGRYGAEGPGIRTVTYLDGALRARQVQDTAPGQTVVPVTGGAAGPPQPGRRVAETRYDHEGRPAVNFLAVPVAGAELAFLPGFNRAADGTPFGPEHFDLDGVTAASPASGAARYFSPQSTVGGPASPYVADAEGYPFTVAQHTRDRSARLRAMSGYGAAQRLGGGHHTRYVYGDASEAQLRPLFGANLAGAEQYERTIVGDANGAYEVLYRDGADRVVAQALVGDPPTGLADLPGAPAGAVRAVSMDAGNQVDAQAGVSSLSHRIANAVQTTYHFAYAPTGVDYAADPGDPRFPPLCASCRYRLVIRVVGPDGAPVPLAVGSTPQNDPGCDGLASNSLVQVIDRTIENPAPPVCTQAGDRTTGYTVPPIRFCARLASPGEYEVQKRLTLLDGDIDAVIAETEATPGFFDVSRFTPAVDPAACGADCTAHCAQATGKDPAAVPRDPALDQCVRSCEHPEGWAADHVARDRCNSLEAQLRTDLAPGGRLHQPGGIADPSRHPEWCHVAVCRSMAASDSYDVALGALRTWNDALCQGGLDPTGLGPDPVLGPPVRPATCPGAATLDPFFAAGGPGASLRPAAEAMLRNYTASVSGWAGPHLSIWQFAADPRVHRATGSSLDDQWRLFRSLYLGVKQQLAIRATEDPSLFSCAYSTDPQARVPRPIIPTTATAVEAAIQDATGRQCQALCEIRVNQWVAQLQQGCPGAIDVQGLRQGLSAYCLSSCGADNPLALLTKERLQAGAPGLAAAQASLGACSLGGVAVEDPYVRVRMCREQCCADTGPTSCANALGGAVAERLPATSQPPPPVAATATGRTLRESCLTWAEEVEFTRDGTVLRDKPGRRRCTVVLVAPDGRPLPTRAVRILSPPRAPVAPPPAAAGAVPLAWTGLVVDVEAGGRRLVASVHSDCPIDWLAPLSAPVCQDGGRLTGPPGACARLESRRPGTTQRESTRGAAATHAVGTPAASPLTCVEGSTPRPEASPTPEKTCPSCLLELEEVLEGRKATELRGGVQLDGECILRAQLEGGILLVRQPGAAGPTRCEVRFVDATGRFLMAGQFIEFGEVDRNAVLPPGVADTLAGVRFAGMAVEVHTAAGPVRAWLYTDCALSPPEGCGTGCTIATRPSACWQRLLAAARTGARPPNDGCFTAVRVSREGLVVTRPDGGPCRVVAVGRDGRPVASRDLVGATARFTGGADPGQAPPGLAFTGHVVETRRGPAAVYSDCAFPAEPDCSTVVVGIDISTPPPPGDPVTVCRDAAQDAADQAGRVAVDAARGAFATTFRSVHFSRCFGPGLRETFAYEARDREYHYTLRYYDQAGNLVQTVPPQGVDPVPGATAATAVQHRLAARFRYDSLDRITSRSSPDTGEQRFLHDAADRVRFSQDAQQKVDGTWAYVKYDARNRPVETGVLAGIGEAVVRARLDEVDFPGSGDGTREDVVRTVYDSAASVPACTPLAPRNLRSRVAAVVADGALGATTLCYSYDPQGRTEAVLRELPGLGAKLLRYDFDFVTGRVAAVHYQPGQPDALHQRYRYGPVGELLSAESSRDGVLWDRDARFTYYAHGPLARMELGEDRVQGVDYTYTIDGRPKGLNTGTLTPDRDPGQDGRPGGANAAVPPDVAGLSLDYFAGDYRPVGLAAGTLAAAADPHAAALLPGAGAPAPSAFALASCPASGVSSGCGLFEGSVVRSVLGLSALGATRVTGFAYRYDRLYRLTLATSHGGLDPATNRWPTIAPGPSLWRTALGYDGNGNVAALERDAPPATGGAGPGAMDRLTYRYPVDAQGRLTADRLLHVADAVAAGDYPEDLDDQGPFAPADPNYAYDAAGRLARDRAAGLTAIRWNAAGQVRAVERAGETLVFAYDGLAHRWAKVHQPAGDPEGGEVEYFVRDERGSLLATYRRAAGAPAPALTELYLRGGIPLGVIRTDGPPLTSVPAGTVARVRGDRQYQIANYLGHVVATVGDRRAAVTGAGGAVDHHEARVVSSTDYDPFGAVQPGRFQESEPYRFGFSGFERDDELKGRGASYYTQERLYDPRLARWLSADPIQTAQRSPYAAFANNPLRYADPRGAWDTDAILDTLENVAITARDIGNDTARILSGQAAAEAIAANLVKAKAAVERGRYGEALGHAIGVQDAVDSLIEKELAWQEAGASTEDMVRMGIGEVTGMNDVVRAVTGETEYGVEIPTLERVQLGIQGGVQVVSVATSGAQLAKSAVGPKPRPGQPAPKASVKPIQEPPCPLSFDGATPVWTPDGLVPIAALREGDEVLTLHPESGQTGRFTVAAPTITRHPEATRLVLVAADGRGETILTTPEHAFWQAGAGWVIARELAPGARVAGEAGGWLSVASVSSLAHPFDAFNLSVEGAHTYRVGVLGAWVHNCGPTDRRVKLRKTVKADIEARQPRDAQGRMIDPNTKQPLKPGEIDVGHKPGNEWRTRKKVHEQKGSTRKEVIEAENDPDLYQLEDRSSNRSHKYEQK
ncbi:MAG TPA: GH-E family nuclease [Anaeromyxobacter sp.]|nr:GH-E family nuclease [Anaeromyxobacter sp.]